MSGLLFLMVSMMGEMSLCTGMYRTSCPSFLRASSMCASVFQSSVLSSSEKSWSGLGVHGTSNSSRMFSFLGVMAVF